MPKPRTRRYTVEIQDDKGKAVIFTAADWTVDERRVAVAQVLRLAGVPADNCLTQPAPKRDKD